MIVKFFTDINLSKMKNFLHFDLMQKIANCLTEDHALGNRYESFQTAFLAAFRRLDDAMMTSRKSLLTPEIQKLDAQRVQEWRLIRAAVKEQTRMTSEAVTTVAGFVLSLITNHGDIQAMKVTERTGALTNLAQDLTVKYATQVEAVGMAAFAAQLAATNAEYLRLYEQRLHEWSEYTDGEVQAARTATDEALENLLIMVSAGILTEGMTTFKHFVDYVNEAIKVAKIAMRTSTRPDDSEGSNGEGGGSNDSEEQAWPEIPEGTTREFGVMFVNEDGEALTDELLPYGSPITVPEAPEGMRWPLNLPTTVPYGDIFVAPVPTDTPSEPLYTFEYRDGERVLRTDRLPAASVYIRYPLPDGKVWGHTPEGLLTPAEDWYLEVVAAK